MIAYYIVVPLFYSYWQQAKIDSEQCTGLYRIQLLLIRHKLQINLYITLPMLDVMLGCQWSGNKNMYLMYLMIWRFNCIFHVGKYVCLYAPSYVWRKWFYSLLSLWMNIKLGIYIMNDVKHERKSHWFREIYVLELFNVECLILWTINFFTDFLGGSNNKMGVRMIIAQWCMPWYQGHEEMRCLIQCFGLHVCLLMCCLSL